MECLVGTDKTASHWACPLVESLTSSDTGGFETSDASCMVLVPLACQGGVGETCQYPVLMTAAWLTGHAMVQITKLTVFIAFWLCSCSINHKQVI
jgi:hypothetical protein